MPDPASVTVRKASAADIAAVLDLYAQPDLDDGKILSVEAGVALFERFNRYPDYTLYVAEQDEQIVGTFALLVMDNLGHLGSPSAIVEDVVVAPDRQSQGIGAVMMRFALDRAREKRIYAIPPYTQVVSLDFEDHPFEPYRHDATCALCGSTESFLDEVITDDRGSRMFLCSDTDYCEAERERGPQAAAPPVHRGEAGHG